MDLDIVKIAVGALYVGFALVEIILGRFGDRDTATRRDTIADAVSTALVPLVIIPVILFLAPFLAEAIWPQSEDRLAWINPVAMFAILLLADDLTQYWWHRLSHTSWLYPLHRAHHSAPYMSVRIVYRNNLIYYAIMPGLWLSGLLIYWGFGVVYLVYAFFKMSVIIAAHSSVPWDEPLYRHPLTSKVMWVVERVISTPATHSAHHGLHRDDGVTHYHGNYGNFLFFWDVLFGTAKITRERPEAFGIEGLHPVKLWRELVLPQKARAKREQ